MAVRAKRPAKAKMPAGDPLWYKDAVIYQVHVRSFFDSDGDGIGDFLGLTEKLDYLQDLGVTALWLLPFYPSPLRDDGYDIADYTNVNPTYGTKRDFQAFLKEAKRRGLRVITELVLNHTSDEHPWFQRARRAPPDSSARDFYVWNDTPDKYRGARIIFKDFETSNWAWDASAQAYYWHRFYSHQPDLNFDNPEVHEALFKVVESWLQMGVDGLRLDAVPYLYEREGTSCENLPETHQFLRRLRKRIDKAFPGRMLLAEANQWPEDAAAYFGDGDECNMNFHFPLMPRLFMAVHQEDRFPIIDILDQTPDIPENCQWAMFLRNHDELTLEMVTDEDRDYMYRVYAKDAQARINLGIRRRLAPLLGNNRRRIELMNGLLLSLPGTPIVYYGDEIGMGDNIYLGDRNAVRTPMQWSGDRNAGFSRANPQRLFLPVNTDPEYHYETVNVEAQHGNAHSLFWWMKRIIALRNNHKAFGRGSIEFLHCDNRKVLAFVRKYEDETILVIANLSRFAQYAELGMSAYAGSTPIELFGRTEFPEIGELPYLLTLGPHAFYWFSLRTPPGVPGTAPVDSEPETPTITISGTWKDLLKGRNRGRFEKFLPDFLQARRWFGGKARAVHSASIEDVIKIPARGLDVRMVLVQINYVEGEPETYQTALAFASGETAEKVAADWPQSIVARIDFEGQDQSAVVYEATANPDFLSLLLDSVARSKKYKGENGSIVALKTAAFRRITGTPGMVLEPRTLRAEQSNTSIEYGDRFIMKLVRRPDIGENPDLEIGRYLTERADAAATPKVAGYLEYQRHRQQPITLAILHEYIPNEGDAWSYTLDSVTAYLERVLSEHALEMEAPPIAVERPLDLIDEPVPELASELFGAYLQSAELLGRRTGELHVALGAATDNPDFAPEAFTQHYQRSIYQGMRGMVAQSLPLLKKRVDSLTGDVRQAAERVLSQEPKLMARFHSIIDQKLTGMRIRTHGDFHLGQLLFTGKDFVIIDFEGEPVRPLSERRLKRAPLRDVAGMLRSFHYAAHTAVHNQVAVGMVRDEQIAEVEAWARYWYIWTAAAYLRGYLNETRAVTILPQDMDQISTVLDAYLLEKALYEVAYELNNRPEWVQIPLAGIVELLEEVD